MDLFKLIRKLYGIEELQGYSDEDIIFLKEMFGDIPSVLEEYYLKAGRTEKIMHSQDEWILPEKYQQWSWLKNDKKFYILMNENQGVFQFGILREDMFKSNPPVYYINDQNYIKYCDNLSEFLFCQSVYQSVFTLQYSPDEFYLITDEELRFIEKYLQKYPFEIKNDEQGYPFNIAFFYNDEENLYVVMKCEEGFIQVLYGAVSQKSFDKLKKVVGEIGEPI